MPSAFLRRTTDRPAYPEQSPWLQSIINNPKPTYLKGARFSELGSYMKSRKIRRGMGIAMTPAEKTKRRADRRIKNMCFELGLPESAKKEAMFLFGKAVGKRLLKGRSINGVAAALIFYVCKRMGAPRSMRDITAPRGISEKEAYKTYKLLSKELGLKARPPGAEDYLPRFACELGLGMDIQNRARKLIEGSKGIRRSPKIMAATALYLASGKGLTQKETARKLKVSEVSLRNAAKEMGK